MSWLSRLRRGTQEEPDKGDHELAFWRERLKIEGRLTGPHYPKIMMDQFGLGAEFFAGKAVLDVGCGPRGSLDWCNVAALRIGVDPLSARYFELGTGDHAMDYVASGAE